MPKVLKPTINLVLRKEKPLKDGLFPIFLRVSFNGVVERATGYSCDIAHWDKASQVIKRGFPNYKSINDSLSVLKAASIDRMEHQRYDGKGYDKKAILFAQEPLKEDGVNGCPPHSFSGLVGAYLASNSLSYNTRQVWRNLKNRLISCFGDDISKWDIDKFILNCESDGLSDSTIALLLGKVKALGLNMKNIDIRRYRVAQRNTYIPKQTMGFIRERLLSLMVEFEGERYRYRDDFIQSFARKNGLRYSIWSIYIFYLLYLTALAPIDLAFLKKKNVDIISIKDDDYYIISGHRSKTGVPFKVSLKRNLENNILIGSLLMFTPDEYLTPICTGLTDIEKMNNRQRNVINKCSPKLKEHFRAINEDIVRHNVEEKDNVPLINMDCTFYSARHSRATQIFNSPLATPAMLSQIMGRSVNNIGTYIHQLSSEQDLARMADATEV